MSFAAVILFFVSLLLIVLLFVLKRFEVRRGARIGESFRAQADVGALRVKQWLEAGETFIENIPLYASALARYGVHIGALGFARAARGSAEQAHRLADLVSHKRNFERRETKSQFLRDVSEYKNGNGNSHDTTGQV